MSIELSTSLDGIARELGKLDADKPVPTDRIANLVARLVVCADLARNMEIELNAFRLLEGDRQGRAFMEAEAADAMNVRNVPRDGKILRPDFGRKE